MLYMIIEILTVINVEDPKTKCRLFWRAWNWIQTLDCLLRSNTKLNLKNGNYEDYQRLPWDFSEFFEGIAQSQSEIQVYLSQLAANTQKLW